MNLSAALSCSLCGDKAGYSL